MDGDGWQGGGGPEGGARRPAGGGARRGPAGRMAAAAAAAAVAAAFLGGYALGSAGGGGVTNDELAAMISEMRGGQGAPLLVSADDDPVKGDPAAPVRIVEFSDFQCPFCARFYRDTLPLIERDYIDTGIASLVYRDMPLPTHPNAPLAHAAAECADDRGAFWEYHDLLFERAGQWGRLGQGALAAELESYAAELGIGGGFAGCLASPEAMREVRADLADGSRYGATGTPTFFIGSDAAGYEALVGAQPYEAFRAAIDAAAGP